MNRSENVFQAKDKVRENYRLCRICARATREMHAGAGRIEDTITVAMQVIGNTSRFEPLLTSYLHDIRPGRDPRPSGSLSPGGLREES